MIKRVEEAKTDVHRDQSMGLILHCLAFFHLKGGRDR
jgi:hypothetical protein